MKKQILSRLEIASYFILIFFLLKEWLSPIMTLTKTGYFNLILIFIALSLFLKWLNVYSVISWIVKIIYIGWFIVHVYSDTSFLSREGLAFLLDVIQYNLSFIFAFDLEGITNPFRSILLFILIWMLIYLIHHWIVYKLNIFYFLLMSVIFIGTLDTFTEYDGSTAIVKIIVIGLIMSTFLYLKRLLNESSVKVDYKKYIKMGFPIILIVGGLAVLSTLLPKAAPQWPDPVPYIKSATSSENILGKNKVSKIGYDEDDSQLGGPFVGDDTIVFKVIDNKEQYWRVETKDVYTSKGWESSRLFSGRTVYEVDEQILHSLPIGPEENTEMAVILNENANDFLIYPYGIKALQLNELSGLDVHVEMDENNEKLYLMDGTSSIKENQYSVKYSTPTYKFSDLTNPNDNDIDENSMLKDLYLQLPDTLPQRVIDLAHEIVEGKNSTYEKARAIEMYFRQNGFRYDTKNVSVPKENQDYVDQFLFETKVGYCDNFSTSMVVLLRSVGIPARWVKGFVTGKLEGIEDGKRIYQITNNEAHSWVEAYIPNVGWVNFEPTIGFTNNRSIDFDIEINDTEEDMLEVKEETKPEVKKEDKKEEKKDTSQSPLKLKNISAKNKIIVIVSFIVLLAIIVTYLIMRKKWNWKMNLRSLKGKPMTEENIEQHYLLLLKMLEKQGLKRKEGQTLSSFAQIVDEKYNTDVMTEFTSKYEQFIYSKESSNIDFDKLKEMWEYLVKRSTS